MLGYLQTATQSARTCLSSSPDASVIVAWVTAALVNENVIHTVGCGHSALVAAEPAYRAGGLVQLNFLGLLPSTSGWIAATNAESNEALAAPLIDNARPAKDDALVAVSHSGQSPLVCKTAEIFRKRYGRVIAITRSAETPLAKVSDGVLATSIPPRDCAFGIGEAEFGSLSSVVASIVLNAILSEAAKNAIQAGRKLALYRSVHSDGEGSNKQHLEYWRHRTPCLDRLEVAP
jgi:uncharacterized phosphosugar-binding protein